MDVYSSNNYATGVTSYQNNAMSHLPPVYTSVPSSTTNSLYSTNSREQLKRNLTLDLEAQAANGKAGGGGVIKRGRMSTPNLITPINPNNRLEILQSPDLHMLKLGSPEIEKLILSQNITILSAGTPGGGSLSAIGGPNSQIFFPKSTTEEQEVLVKGFQEALTRIQQNNNMDYDQNFAAGGGGGLDWGRKSDNGQENLHSNSSADDDDEGLDTDDNSMTSGSMMSSYSSSNNAKGQKGAGGDYGYGNVVIKQEPGLQIVPNMSGGEGLGSQQPIDMISQEKIKLERKRQRNRVAASKCRKRKLERIAKLEDKVKQIKQENADLASIAEKLRDSVKKLKAEISQHTALGCTFAGAYNL